MVSSGSADVVIVGGGVVGVSTAYLLAREGVSSVIVEKDSVGSHASGFAYGGLSRPRGIGPTCPCSPRLGGCTSGSAQSFRKKRA